MFCSVSGFALNVIHDSVSHTETRHAGVQLAPPHHVDSARSDSTLRQGLTLVQFQVKLSRF
jgi:hypothetical protein